MELALNCTQSFAPSLLGEPGAVVSLVQSMAPAAASVFCVTWMWRVCSKTSGWINRSKLRRNVAQLVSPLRTVIPSPPLSEDEESLIFNSFPDEVLLSILSHVPTSNLLELASVNQKWKSMCYESISNVCTGSSSSFWSGVPENQRSSKFAAKFSEISRNMSQLVLYGEKFGSRSVQIIATAKKLTSLSLDSVRGGARVCRAIGKLTELRSLELNYMFLPDSSFLRNFSSLSKLESLKMWSLEFPRNVPAPDRALTFGKWLPKMRELTLESSGFPEEGFSFLADLDFSSLNSLSLIYTRVPPRHATHISRLTNLRSLFLSNSSNLQDDSFDFLKPLTRLATLELVRTRVSDAALSNFAKLTNLETLNLSDCSMISGAYLAHATSQHTNLTKLNMQCCPLTSQHVTNLSFLTNLIDLNIRSVTSLSSEPIVVALTPLVKLEALEVSGCSSLASISFVSSMESLTKLEAAHCPLVNSLPATISKRLRRLDLSRTGLAGDALASLAGSTYLSQLDINNLPHLDPAALRHLGDCRNIYSINVHGTPVSVEGLRSLLDGGSYVASMNCSQSPTFDDSCMELLCTHPNSRVTTLFLSDCPKLTEAGLNFLSKVKQLYFLQLGKPLTDASLSLLGGIPQLAKTTLSIERGATITASGLIAAFSDAKMPRGRLYLRDSFGFTADEKAKVRAAIPDISMPY